MKSCTVAPTYNRIFEEKVSEHFKNVKNLCFRFLKNDEIAAEVAQEVFLKAFREYSSLRNETQFRPWVKQIARNLCIDTLKKSAPKREAQWRSHVKMTNAEYQTDQALDGLTHHKFLLEKIFMEDSDTMTLVFQNKVMGVNIKELAVRYNKSPSAIKMRIHRYRKSVNENIYCDQMVF